MNRRRILFVDDEPNVLEALRRALRVQRREWDVVFAGSGAEALSKMAEAPVDVIVTDMLMPGMNGAELLERLAAEHPDTVRIVLSGHADDALTTRALKVTHQFLAKPADLATIKEAVEEACAIRRRVPSKDLRSCVAGLGVLPTEPRVCLELSRAAESSASDARTIARIVRRDTAATAKLLQLVNSSFFGLGRRVSSIDQAVALLGVARIRSLVLASQLADRFQPTAPIPGFSIHRFHDRAARVADLACQIAGAEGLSGQRRDAAFTAGLLHDVGMLVLAARESEVYEGVLETVFSGAAPLCEAERAAFGADHAEVGAYLLGLWRLPAGIVNAVARHHDPAGEDPRTIGTAMVVHTAAALIGECVNEAVSDSERRFAPTLDAAYLEKTGLLSHVERWRSLACLSNPEPARCGS